jgi:hypothetical protein
MARGDSRPRRQSPGTQVRQRRVPALGWCGRTTRRHEPQQSLSHHNQPRPRPSLPHTVQARVRAAVTRSRGPGDGPSACDAAPAVHEDLLDGTREATRERRRVADRLLPLVV